MIVWIVESHNSDSDTGGIEGVYSSKGKAELVQQLWDHEGDNNAWVEGPFEIDGPPVTDPDDLAKEEVETFEYKRNAPIGQSRED